MTDPTLLLVDKLVRSRATYVPDAKLRDTWTSYAREVNQGLNFAGDCDDWAMTALELLMQRGWPKNRLYRALVSSTGNGVIDHMIGIAELPNGERWTVGDTFGAPRRVTGDRAGPHKILQTSRMDERRGGLPLWRFWSKQPFRRMATAANGAMKISERGLAFIKGHEKLMTVAYDDFRPSYRLKPGDVVRGTLTIGYGHTGRDFKAGDVWSRERAERALLQDLTGFENEVRRQVRVPLAQHQYDTLVSFCFNCGIGNFRSSTLLKKVNARAPAHEIQGQLRRWIRSKGKVLNGLVTRREAEAQMWVGSYAVTTHATPMDVEVSAVPLVEETSKLSKSVTLWLTGLSVAAPLLLEASRELRYVGLETDRYQIAQWAGGIMITCAILIFAKRVWEIVRSKQ